MTVTDPEVLAAFDDSTPVELDGEAYLRWLETGEGDEPCPPGSSA